MTADVVYVIPGTHITFDTRHEAIGNIAKHWDWDSLDPVPVCPEAVAHLHDQPEHIGNEYYGDRHHIPTTAGVTNIDIVAVQRLRNGREEEIAESYWESDCPVCGRSHQSDGSSEDDRMDAWNAMLDCCGVEWVPPADWIEDCTVCGEDHRERHGCRPVASREPYPGIDHDFRCARCDWEGHGEHLQGPNGECPSCDSPGVQVVSEA